jgi:hypothetical protein
MEENTSKPDVRGGPCCFCGEDILSTDTDPCHLTVETARGAWQVWFCHGKCFKDRIVNHSQIDLSPAHF